MQVRPIYGPNSMGWTHSLINGSSVLDDPDSYETLNSGWVPNVAGRWLRVPSPLFSG